MNHELVAKFEKCFPDTTINAGSVGDRRLLFHGFIRAVRVRKDDDYAVSGWIGTT